MRHQLHRGEVVFNYFDNLLPDNKAIRDRIQARFKARTSHPFDLLAAIGMDCVGALQIAPEDEPLQDVRRIAGEPLSDTQIAKLLGNYRSAPLGMSADEGEYESDGGPGVVGIMRLLQQSRKAKQDRAQFFKSLILFWLMAAIDGHAKNFSVFIEAEGRFKLTPLYDIMSAHPLIASKQPERQKIKMAMALPPWLRHRASSSSPMAA